MTSSTTARLRSRAAAALLVVLTAVGLSVSATPAEAAQPAVVSGSRAAIVAGAKYVVDRAIGYGPKMGFGHSTAGPGPTAKTITGDPDAKITWVDGYMDCSALVRYAYSRAGIDLGTGGTSSQIGRFEKLAAGVTPLPGDVVFYGVRSTTTGQKEYLDPSTGKWWDVYHVALIDGTGKKYEATTFNKKPAYSTINEDTILGYFRLKPEFGKLSGQGGLSQDPVASAHHVYGDFDGDGIDDVLWFTGRKGSDTGTGYGWQLARGGQENGAFGAFHRVLNSAVTPETAQVAVGDFDGDGIDDLLRFTGRVGSKTGTGGGWRLASGGQSDAVGEPELGDFRRVKNSALTPKNAHLMVGDFDGDGSDDVLRFTGSESSGWKLARGGQDSAAGARSFDSFRTVKASALTPANAELELGDFNADGADDVLWFTGAKGAGSGWQLALGAPAAPDGAMTMREFFRVKNNALTPSTAEIAVGDFNGNGTDDVLWFTGEEGTATGDDNGWQIALGRRDTTVGDKVFFAFNRAANLALTPASAHFAYGDFDGRADDVLWFTGAAAGTGNGWQLVRGKAGAKVGTTVFQDFVRVAASGRIPLES
ncbi:FG-GAP-like repeat-containing protein [Demequina silvatica]|uniref:FG-GAP-like repeat-containing protein n=1 Tax=Demequina silvatica TaxID=1638988 RepID=UPI00078519FB|nr:FG-GAP-like repeat-containing protein [Demequina silvatica]